MAGEEKYFVKGNKLSTCKLQGREIATLFAMIYAFQLSFRPLEMKPKLWLLLQTGLKNEENIGSVCFRHGQLKTRFTFWA